MADAFLGYLLQAFLDGVTEGGGDPHIKAAADEGKAEGFAREFGKLDTDAAENALAGLENDATGLDKLFEFFSLLAEAAWVRAVLFGVSL